MTILPFTGTTTVPLDCDQVLEGARGKLDYVVVIGWQKDKLMYVAASTSDMEELVYLLSKTLHDVHAGEFGE